MESGEEVVIDETVSVKSKSSPSAGKTTCMSRGWKSSGSRKGRESADGGVSV